MEKTIIDEIYELIENKELQINNETPLIGDDSPLDSMNIVSLCVRLEEIAEEMNFEFDWSGETMSKSKSMFLSVSKLSEEFLRQKNSK
tara:strand:- start:534 stop:797 length:264 start_codon:yes stop_codon:yes gene_type:complete